MAQFVQDNQDLMYWTQHVQDLVTKPFSVSEYGSLCILGVSRAEVQGKEGPESKIGNTTSPG